MIFKISTKILICLVFFISSCHGKLPSTIEVCSRNDPNLDKCIINSVLKLQPLLASGKLDDEYQLPQIEPFNYEDFKIEHGAGFKIEIKNLQSWNGSNFEIEKFRVNLEKLTFDFIVHIPKIKLTGKYSLNARLAVLEISGAGDMESIVRNSRMRMKLFSSKFEKDGVTHVRFDKVTVRMQAGKSQIKLTNLFNGDPTLGRIGNDLINENQDLFLGDIIPVLENQFENIFLKVANQIVENATFDEILPDNVS